MKLSAKTILRLLQRHEEFAMTKDVLSLDYAIELASVRIQLIWDVTTAESPNDLAAWINLDETPYLTVIHGYPNGPSDDEVSFDLAATTNQGIVTDAVDKLRRLGLLDRYQDHRFDNEDLLTSLHEITLKQYVKRFE